MASDLEFRRVELNKTIAAIRRQIKRESQAGPSSVGLDETDSVDLAKWSDHRASLDSYLAGLLEERETLREFMRLYA